MAELANKRPRLVRRSAVAWRLFGQSRRRTEEEVSLGYVVDPNLALGEKKGLYARGTFTLKSPWNGAQKVDVPPNSQASQ